MPKRQQYAYSREKENEQGPAEDAERDCRGHAEASRSHSQEAKTERECRDSDIGSDCREYVEAYRSCLHPTQTLRGLVDEFATAGNRALIEPEWSLNRALIGRLSTSSRRQLIEPE